MRRYADPSRCPSCGSALASGATACAACGLDLSGPLGMELFTTLTRADQLLAALWARSAPAPAATTPAPAPPAGAPPYPLSPPVTAPPPAAPPKVRGSSVPKILLGLGAACLLVAALVFIAVTWSVMSVGGRTATLVGFTLTTGALTAWVARRGLRGATEALGLVTLGLAVLDVYGADNAGWLGDPSAAGLTAIVGCALVAGGLASTWALARTEAGGFTSGEVAAVVGAVMVSIGVATQDWASLAVRQLLVVCLVLALTAGVWLLVRPGRNLYRVAGWLLGPVLFLDWLALVITGIERLGPHPTMSSAWGHLGAWPLVAASAVALLVAAVRRLPTLLRVAAGAAALVPLGIALVAPAADESTTTGILAVTTLSLGLAALMALAPRPWGATGTAAGALCALGLAAEVALLLSAALDQYATTAAMAWSGSPGGRLVEPDYLGDDVPWLLPVCVATLLVLLWAAARLLEAGRAIPAARALAGAAVILGASAVATFLLYPVPVWTVLLLALLVSIGVGWPALTQDNPVSAVVGGAGLFGTAVLSLYDEQLTAAVLLVSLVLVTVVHLRTRLEETAAATAALVAGVLAGLVWTLGAVGDVAGTWSALVGLVALSALALGRHYLPVGLRTARVDLAVEVSAGLVAVPLAAAGLTTASDANGQTWLAVYLTVAGAAATILSILRPDRRPVAWLGGALLVMATWVRLADLGVEEPEPYTLPSAVALLVVGLLHLRRDRSADTLRSLGAGLGLALVPSMLWVLEDPTSVRALVLGLTCLVLVVGGAWIRWAAPLLFGAVVGLVVVLREAGPYIGDAVPRWALIGAAGALLIAMGITWEQRLRDAQRVTAYLRGLR